MISLLPDEAARQESLGFKTRDGMLLPNPKTGKCPHKKPNGLCGLHYSPYKPFGCIASPFTLNGADTLIVRNRYNMMKCHGHGQPAYVCFRASLDLILRENAAQVIQQIISGKDSIDTEIDGRIYENLKYLDGIKHSRPSY